MKKKLLTAALAATMAVGGAMSAMAAEPVYFNDFENGAGDATIVGNGAIETDANKFFGGVFHNAAGGQAIRSNYLLLPEDVLAQSAETKELSIGFWVNVGTATDYFWTPIFSAYGAEPTADGNTWPMMILQSRLLAQVNCAGYTDYTVDDYKLTLAEDGTIPMGTQWLDDAQWHYYTAVFDDTSLKIYIDGTLSQHWESDGTDGHNQFGLFSNGADLKYVCLGGNQAWNWADVDPAYLYDDVAIYNTALTETDIKAIITDKTTEDAPVVEENAPAADSTTPEVNAPETDSTTDENVKVEEEKAPTTGDSSAVVVLGLVAAGAALAVLSTKKNVTE